MKTTNLKETNLAKPRKWFQRRRRRWHDPILVLNMSIFNSENGWNRILHRLPSHENLLGDKPSVFPSFAKCDLEGK
jgi:hypothetical protein